MAAAEADNQAMQRTAGHCDVTFDFMKRFPMFLTRAVYDAYVTVPPNVFAQDEPGRLWDIVWMTRFAILRAKPAGHRVPVALYVRNDNRAAKLIKLIATCGPLDMDDPQPSITVMMPDED